MTTKKLLQVVARRWYAALVVMLLGVVSLGSIRSSEPVYWTQAEVSFVGPAGKPWYLIPNADVAPLVEFAALVERQVNHDSSLSGSVTSPGTLYGAGVKQGYSITLPNAGGQWAKSFRRPALAVQVVDSSAAKVNEQLAALVKRIEAATLLLQEQTGKKGGLIYTITFPSSPEVVFGGGSTSNRIKGAIAWLSLSLGLAVVGAVGWDQILVRRTRRRGRAGQFHGA
ncbi:hypothetical protein VUN82_14585 [Micrococcaceae bacterium Sec5.1]